MIWQIHKVSFIVHNIYKMRQFHVYLFIWVCLFIKKTTLKTKTPLSLKCGGKKHNVLYLHCGVTPRCYYLTLVTMPYDWFLIRIFNRFFQKYLL